MEEHSIEQQMDDHLNGLQRLAKTTLEKFEKNGMKIDKKFMTYFQKISIDRLTQTCERYIVESKWKSMPTAIPVPQIVKVDLTDEDVEGMLLKRKPPDDESAELPVKIPKLSAPNTNDDNQGISEDKHLDWALYCCNYCPSEAGSLDQVYIHWFDRHLDDEMSKPFKFNAVPLASCFHCKKLTSYYDLVGHHDRRHSDKQFVITDQSDDEKCAVCDFKGNLVEHFKDSHCTISKEISPIYFSDDHVTKLLSIDINKEYQCIDCQKMFKSHAQMMEHSVIEHLNSKDPSESRTNTASKLSHVCCGHCKKEVYDLDYLTHYWEHTYNFKCSKCSYQSAKMADLVCHEKMDHNIDSLNHHCSTFEEWKRNRILNTEMLFNNGLVMKKSCVLGTELDDSKLFDMFIEGFLDCERKQTKRLIESSKRSDAVNIQLQQQQKTPQKQKPPTTESDISLSNSESEATEDCDAHLVNEWNKQRSLANNLYLCGIPLNISTDDVYDIFKRICEKLYINIDMEDVLKILRRKTDCVVIQLREECMKNRVLRGRRTWTTNQLGLSRYLRRMRITVDNHFTSYYFKIYSEVKQLKQNGKLSLYSCDHRGFLVKKTKNDPGMVIRSLKQLTDYIST